MPHQKCLGIRPSIALSEFRPQLVITYKVFEIHYNGLRIKITDYRRGLSSASSFDPTGIISIAKAVGAVDLCTSRY